MEQIFNWDLIVFLLIIIHVIKILEVFVTILTCLIGVKFKTIQITALHKMVRHALT